MREVDGATGSGYDLTEDEEGLTVQVGVSFNDDAGNEESLTSAPTAQVAGPPLTVTLSRATGEVQAAVMGITVVVRPRPW